MALLGLSLREEEGQERKRKEWCDAGKVWVWWQRMEGVSYFCLGRKA